MFFTQNPRKPGKIKIGVHEAYTIWRCLVDRYVFIDHFNLLKNFTHDKDFLIYLNRIIEGYKDEVAGLEEMCKVFSIPSPQPSATDQSTTGNSEVLWDEQTAGVVYRFFRLDLNILLLGLKNSYTNDDVKEELIRLVKNAMNRVDNFVMYIKAKNWVQTPPLYPFVNPDIPEKLTINEVFLLFDHLIFRYNNMHQTSTFSMFCSDADLKVLLEAGTKILGKQIEKLEKELLYYGVTLPNPNPIHVPAPEKKEVMEDSFIFNIIFRGMQDAMVLHGTAISE